MMKNEQGFTLSESLIVLSIVLLIASVSVMQIKIQTEQIEAQIFFTQLKGDILYAQQYAISHRKTVYMQIHAKEHYYVCQAGFSGKKLTKRYYSENISIQRATMPLSFSFSASGNINTFGILYLTIHDEAYNIIFQLGKGRFYYEKI
ncbi:type II secretion system protein [Bacillaceae bacterium Marseille-Q3522]|nr:type II secretion system protein [Bacillaceae bacterium Marseille-Q3522]